MSKNPYQNVDLTQFSPIELGRIDGFVIFRFNLMDTKKFDGCVFRDYLFRFLFDECEGEFHLGNDDRFIQISPHDLILAVRPVDYAKVIRRDWLNHYAVAEMRAGIQIDR